MQRYLAAMIVVLGSAMLGLSEASAGCRCAEQPNYGPSVYGYYAPADYYAVSPYYLAPRPYGYYHPVPYPYYAPRPAYGYLARPQYDDRYYGYARWRRW